LNTNDIHQFVSFRANRGSFFSPRLWKSALPYFFLHRALEDSFPESH
jgi:hypothetical protein